LGNFEHDEDEEDEDEDAEGEDELPEENLFRSSFAPGKFQNNDLDREIEQAINQEMELEGDDEADSYEEEEEEDEDDDEDEDGYDGQGDEEQSDEEAGEGSEDADMFLNMRHDDRPYGRSVIGEEESDLMMLNTPAATKKVRKEAEAIFKRSSNNLRRSTGRGVFEYGTIAKLLYSQQDIARVNEPGKLILATEDLVSEMYTEGVDTADNEERMEKSLANVTHGLLTIWQDHEANLPQPEGEAFAGIGPDHNADPFDKALWIAQLILRMHHTKFVDGGLLDNKTLPLPQILLEWIDKAHNLYPDQTRLVASHRPSPASHSLFWQTLRSLVLRGETSQATDLLRKAGWEHVRRGPRAEFAYTGKALEHVQQFTNAACDMLDNCPASKSDWDIWNSNWTLFRIQARGFRDKMTLFAEGTDDDFRNSIDEFTNPRGMSNMARKASSQLPWDIYENLQALYGIILGNREAIMDTAQDWLEATVGMLAWWDDGAQHMRKPLRIGGPSDLYQSSLQASTLGSSEDYFERLTAALYIVTKSDLEPNSQNPVEIALASVLEGNVNAVLAILRTWSLPIASAVAEIASLGQWLPPHEVARPFPLDTLDMDDLALLNISQPTPDDVQGIKDSTLEAYSRQLAGIEQLSPERDGWEMAIQVLGRMDVPEKSEEIVGELLRDILTTLDEHSSATVDKMWRILNDLGMINFAEETAEVCFEMLKCRAKLNNTANHVTDICGHFIPRVPSIWRGPVVLRTFTPN
jgi:homoaconitase